MTYTLSPIPYSLWSTLYCVRPQLLPSFEPRQKRLRNHFFYRVCECLRGSGVRAKRPDLRRPRTRTLPSRSVTPAPFAARDRAGTAFVPRQSRTLSARPEAARDAPRRFYGPCGATLHRPFTASSASWSLVPGHHAPVRSGIPAACPRGPCGACRPGQVPPGPCWPAPI